MNALFRLFAIILWAWSALVVAQQLPAESIEILAMGDSQTNGRGLPASDAYPAQLERLLKESGHNVAVINAGVDGDPTWNIFQRMTRTVSPRTKIVIFHESGNDLSPAAGVEYTEKSLAWLRDHGLSCILLSNRRIHPDAEAADLARKYGAIYYGWWKKDVPEDKEHLQPGEYFPKKSKTDYHLTALGYRIIAENLAPLVLRLMDEAPRQGQTLP